MILRVLVLDDDIEQSLQAFKSAIMPFLSDKRISLDTQSIYKASASSSMPMHEICLSMISDTDTICQLCHNPQDFVTDDKVKKWLEGINFNIETFDLVLIDDNWGGNENDLAYTFGQAKLLPFLFNRIKDAHFCLFTQHANQDFRVRDFARLLRKEPYRGTGRLHFLSKDDKAGLEVFISMLIGFKENKQKYEHLKKKINTEQQLAHANYGLLQHVRHLVGIGDLLLEISEGIEPFFQWLRGEYDNFPDQLKFEFIPAILFEGEPGSGKTELCNAIASAFLSDAVLPKNLGPWDAPSLWQQPLRNFINEFYVRARNRCVTVIKADDLVWPPASKISDAGLSADWIAYLNTLRECVEDASRINQGILPIGSIARTVSGPFQGKILWLFARNSDEDVGPMFEPLRQKLMALRLKFPRAAEDRRAILRFRAQRKKIEFEDKALNIAVKETMNYKGRDLIGDETGRRGFIWYAIRRVQRRELARYENGEHELNMTITEDIVQEWLTCEEHLEIISRTREKDDLSRQFKDSSSKEDNKLVSSLDGFLNPEVEVRLDCILAIRHILNICDFKNTDDEIRKQLSDLDFTSLNLCDQATQKMRDEELLLRAVKRCKHENRVINPAVDIIMGRGSQAALRNWWKKNAKAVIAMVNFRREKYSLIIADLQRMSREHFLEPLSKLK